VVVKATLTVQIPQQFTGLVLSNGGFELLSGYADGWSLPASDLARFEIQTSTNLSQGWSTLAASPGILNGQLRVVIPGPASFPTRFLRVVEH
jgi:hypothetical protein